MPGLVKSKGSQVLEKLRLNHAFNPIAEQALRQSQNIVLQRLNAGSGVSMKIPLALISMFLLQSCATYEVDLSLPYSLRDCTEELGGWAGKPATHIEGKEREDILNIASQWAIKHEYLPCNVTLCGAVIDASDGRVSVYITGYGDLNPSARVYMFYPSLRVYHSEYYHSNCPGGVWRMLRKDLTMHSTRLRNRPLAQTKLSCRNGLMRRWAHGRF